MVEKVEDINEMRKLSTKLDGFGYEAKYNNIYDELFSRTGDGFFETKKDILILAAVIGFNLYCDSPSTIERHKPTKADFKKLTPVDFSPYYHIIFGIIISLDDDIKNIFDDNRTVDIINKCASLGIEKLNEILTQDKESYIRNFEDFLENPQVFLMNMFDRERKDEEIKEILY